MNVAFLTGLTLSFFATPQVSAPANDSDMFPLRVAGENGPVDNVPPIAALGTPVTSTLIVPVELLALPFGRHLTLSVPLAGSPGLLVMVLQVIGPLVRRTVVYLAEM